MLVVIKLKKIGLLTVLFFQKHILKKKGELRWIYNETLSHGESKEINYGKFKLVDIVIEILDARVPISRTGE